MLVPFLAAFAAFGTVCLRGLDGHHDGTVLKPALDVWAGQTLYRDSFSQYGPLVTWLQAAGMKMLGAHLFSIRITTVFFYAMIAVLLVALWRRFLPSRLMLWLVFAVWLNLPPFYHTDFHAWSSVYALFFQLLGLWFLLRAFEAPEGTDGQKPAWHANTWFFASGMSAMLVFWCRQPVGMLAVAGLAATSLLYAFLMRKPFAPLSATGGMAAVFGAILLHMHAAGSLADWYRQTIAWPMHWSQATGGNNLHGAVFCMLRRRNETIVLLALLLAARPLVSLAARRGRKTLYAAAILLGAAFFWRYPKPLYQSAIYTLMPLACLVVPVLLLFIERSKRGSLLPRFDLRFWRGVAAATLILSSWPQFYPVPDSRHLFWSLAFAAGFMVYLLWKWLHENTTAVTIMISVWLLNAVCSQWPHLYDKMTSHDRTLDHPMLVHIKVQPQLASRLGPLLATIKEYEQKRAPSGTPVVVEGPNSFYAALATDFSNANKFHCVWKFTGLLPSQFTPQGLDFIMTRRPLIITGTDARPSGTLPDGIRPHYLKSVTLRDPFWDDDLTLWVPAAQVVPAR